MRRDIPAARTTAATVWDRADCIPRFYFAFRACSPDVAAEGESEIVCSIT
jgi:hypothetical protein